jgi:hypothetical protein
MNKENVNKNEMKRQREKTVEEGKVMKNKLKL